jgi:hypothetical protein
VFHISFYVIYTRSGLANKKERDALGEKCVPKLNTVNTRPIVLDLVAHANMPEDVTMEDSQPHPQPVAAAAASSDPLRLTQDFLLNLSFSRLHRRGDSISRRFWSSVPRRMQI